METDKPESRALEIRFDAHTHAHVAEAAKLEICRVLKSHGLEISDVELRRHTAVEDHKTTLENTTANQPDDE